MMRTYRYSTRLFRRILVPVVHGGFPHLALQVARMIADANHIVLLGVVGVPDGESLSAGAVPAREVRESIAGVAGPLGVRVSNRIRVSHKPWDEIIASVESDRPDLLILDFQQLDGLGLTTGAALRFPPCDTIVAAGSLPEHASRVLCALRGGPHAELALRLGLAIGRTSGSRITALHLSPKTTAPLGDAAFKGVDRVLRSLPQVVRKYVRTDDAASGILEEARNCDVVIMGATARPQEALVSIGQVAERVLERPDNCVLIVKSSRPFPTNINAEAAGRGAISVLVDKWFAENTYHASEFEDLGALLAQKRKQHLKISLALPALNEESTVGSVIETLRGALVDRVPILDEVVLVDSSSEDRTREIARELGIPVHVHQEVLPALGPRHGKGEALWKSLYLTSGDIIIWIDTDIANIHPRFVYGLLGPLILRPEIQFVKGFYRRPLRVENKLQAGGGGRVTELTARPLLNLFFPELSGLIQPLSGEYGGRRSALEQLPFSSGYGVEIGLAIDMFEKFGLDSIAQVDLQERIHHNQPLESLSKMSFAIIQTVIRRIERRYDVKMLEEVNTTMKLIRYEQQRLILELDEIAELERPPMIEVPEYLEKFARRQ